MSRDPPVPAGSEPASPCIGVCRLDPVERSCLGCGRTIEEIARWPGASAEERRAILARLAARRPGSPVRPARSARSALDEAG